VTHDIGILFPADGDGEALRAALDSVFAQAEQAIAEGATVLILTDRNLDADHAAIPGLLAAAGLHNHLIRAGKRSAAGILAETGECREVIHFALLIGYGANAICPYAALSTVTELAEQGLLEVTRTPEEAIDNYITAVKKGLLKTFSRMGISTIRSFFGSQIFEAVGLSAEVVETYFTNTTSRIGGIGLRQIAADARARHHMAFPAVGQPAAILDAGGQYQNRLDGERHLWTPEVVYKLQHAVRTGDYAVFQDYTAAVDERAADHVVLRSLFHFKPTEAVPLDEVEPVEAILPRFTSGAMSYGSISREAHETIAIGMNRAGARSNSGEGGEDPARYTPRANGDDPCSWTKQVASGRFGVTIEYLAHARELQIKIAQGAKPGEGGQLPAHKVSADIARVRHTTPGVTLISPPPHHDIYSIEDIATTTSTRSRTSRSSSTTSRPPTRRPASPSSSSPRPGSAPSPPASPRPRPTWSSSPASTAARAHHPSPPSSTAACPGSSASPRHSRPSSPTASATASASRWTASYAPAATSPSPPCSAPRSSASAPSPSSSSAAS